MSEPKHIWPPQSVIEREGWSIPHHNRRYTLTECAEWFSIVEQLRDFSFLDDTERAILVYEILEYFGEKHR